MKSGSRGIIKTCGPNDLFIPGFAIKPKVYGSSLHSANYRRPTSNSNQFPGNLKKRKSIFEPPFLAFPRILLFSHANMHEL